MLAKNHSIKMKRVREWRCKLKKRLCQTKNWLAAGPGAPPKHDWDAFAGAIARRVHDHGMPVSQGELVRDMMDWFAGREDFPPPDERTVRRKVSAIWRELNSA